MLNPESSAWARYVVREQMDPTRAFDELYAAPMGPLLTTISGMLQRLSGDRLDPEEARIRVIALSGQAFAFRVARALALRMTGWSQISAPQADALRVVILSQLDATLDAPEGYGAYDSLSWPTRDCGAAEHPVHPRQSARTHRNKHREIRIATK